MYDVIVIGAGAAGSVLAARLSEDSGRSVLLLEAGPDYRSADQPLEMASPNPFNLLLQPHLQQKYLYSDLLARRTRRQEPRLYWRGKGVGGSTAVNGMIAIRGVLAAFDQWAEIGCEGWSGAEVLPFFNRLESDAAPGDGFHGREGPIPIYRARSEDWGPVDRALRDAALALGHPWCDDLNAPEAEGVCTYAIAQRGGKRVSTNDAYLEAARRRPNLTVIGEANVDRVLLDGRRAVGVLARLPQGVTEFHAPLVILSAGSIHSPTILQRSGIGPADLLRRLGIEVVADLPVGKGFFDHPFVRLELKLRPDLRATNPNARHTNCCVKFSSGLRDAWPRDLLMALVNHGGVGVTPDAAQFGDAGILVALMEARSRGSVTIESTDPGQPPRVDEDMLSHPLDLARMIAATRHLAAIGRQPAVQEICSEIQLGNSGSMLADLDDWDEADLEDWVLRNCNDAQHGIGGCCMRLYDADDRRSVVDPECRVRGIDGLCVVDASIMPLDCQANTNLTTIMIGEKMAARLRSV